MRLPSRWCAVLVLLGTAACADQGVRTTLPPDPQPVPAPVGVYEVAVTGIGTDAMHSTIQPAGTGGAGPSRSLAVVGSGVFFEQVSSTSFTDGQRAAGGQRYISFTYRVRNGSGAALNNLTMLLVARTNTIPGTSLSSFRRFDGTTADSSIAPKVVPTGAASLRSDLVTMEASYPDVLQVLSEAEVAAIPRPADVIDVFPLGFVVRNASPEANHRTLSASAGPNQYDGVLTLSFRLPLQTSATADVFSFTFQILGVEDSETRMTESIEEGQDTGSVRRLRERAAALGATTVTVLNGSPAAGSDVPDYPGQRQLCSVRTAGTAASPTNVMNAPAAYTRLALQRPGESMNSCAANFRGGTALRPVLGTPYVIILRAMDRYGNLVTAAADTVSLTQASGPSATFGAAGALAGGSRSIAVTYHANGTSVLTGIGRRNRGQRRVEVATEATVTLDGGDNQAAMAGSAVPVAPSVVVRDLDGIPLEGVPVTFAVTGGGGYVTAAAATTDANGIAAVGSWVLGSPATVNTLSATAAGAPGPVTFQASGCAGGGGTTYRITLCFTTPMTPAQRAAFEGAAARWQRVVAADLEDVPIGLGEGSCGNGSPSMDLSVDDLLIFASVGSIDGAGGTLGSAAPCNVRSVSRVPFVGMLRMDAADAGALESGGLLEGVVLHEMGHVLGIGTLWPILGLLKNASTVGGPSLDTHYSGSAGIGGFNLVGGSTYTGGQKVPVENTGAAGIINRHWRESVLATELMTSHANTGSMPLSEVTAQSLADLGYTVDPTGIDPFFLTLSVEAEPRGRGIPLIGDVADLPLYATDADGRSTRIR